MSFGCPSVSRLPRTSSLTWILLCCRCDAVVRGGVVRHHPLYSLLLALVDLMPHDCVVIEVFFC